MTTANGPVLFNSSTGSDTQASGLGPSTALFGSGASITSASAVVTGITTTGVSAGDLMWVQSSTGRQYSIIASVDSGTQVTCDDVFDATEASRTWAIGGKRATLDNADSRVLLTDIGDPLTAEIHLETDQQLTSAIASATAGGIIRSSDSTMRTIEQTAAAPHTSGLGTHYLFENIKFTNSSVDNTQVIFLGENTNGGGSVVCNNCIFGDPTDFCGGVCDSSNAGVINFKASGCLIQNMQRDEAFENDRGFSLLAQCLFINNNNCVAQTSGSRSPAGYFINCIFANSISGLNHSRTNAAGFLGCVFYNLTYGARFTVDTPDFLDQNVFVNCGTAIDNTADLTLIKVRQNYFYNNTANYVNQNGMGTLDVELTADPFVDATNGDFNFNSTAGGGAVLRAESYSPNADNEMFLFRWNVKDSFGGGGGTTVIVIEDD